jgi:MFS transporter, DHA2 family, multidrug resistance protein
MPESKVIEGGPVSAGGIGHRPIFAVVAVLLGAFLANFHGRLFTIGLPDLRGALSLSFDEGAWLSTLATAPQIFIAPAVAWLATAFGLRRVLMGPSLLYALVSLLIPLTRDYTTLLTLNVIHGLLIGTFVPASLLIIFRNLPMKWWLVALAIYSFRVGFTVNFGVGVVGFYVDRLGWEWLYWQDIILAPMMGLMVYLGTPHEPVNRALLANADWGGMLMFGFGLAMIYAGLDQGNRLNWLQSGTVIALLISGSLLLVAFFINEAVVRQPWANVSILFSRNIGLSLVVLLFYTMTSLSNSSLVPNFLTTIALLRPEQTGPLLLVCVAVPMFVLLPVAVWLLRRFDVRAVVIVGFAAFAAASLLGTNVTHDWSRRDFIPILLLQAVGQSFTVLPIILLALANSNPARAVEFAAYIQVVRLGGAEIGTSLIATWLRIREQIHSNFLVQYVTSGGADVTHRLNQLSAHFADHGTGLASARALGTLASLVQREANVLAYIDGFWLTFSLAIIALILIACIGRSPPGPFNPASAPQPQPQPATVAAKS